MKRSLPKMVCLALAGVAGLCGAMAPPTAFADGLRCGSRLVTRGDHAVKLLKFCGEPAAVRSWVIERGVVDLDRRLLRHSLGFVEEVLVEEWTYNFGPTRLMRQVRIENGIVRSVESLGYGFRD